MAAKVAQPMEYTSSSAASLRADGDGECRCAEWWGAQVRVAALPRNETPQSSPVSAIAQYHGDAANSRPPNQPRTTPSCAAPRCVAPWRTTPRNRAVRRRRRSGAPNQGAASARPAHGIASLGRGDGSSHAARAAGALAAHSQHVAAVCWVRASDGVGEAASHRFAQRRGGQAALARSPRPTTRPPHAPPSPPPIPPRSPLAFTHSALRRR